MSLFAAVQSGISGLLVLFFGRILIAKEIILRIIAFGMYEFCKGESYAWNLVDLFLVTLLDHTERGQTSPPLYLQENCVIGYKQA